MVASFAEMRLATAGHERLTIGRATVGDRGSRGKSSRDNCETVWQTAAQMKLPNATALIVEREKILDYLLNPVHRYGAAKAKFFTALGFQPDAWEILAEALRAHGRKNEVIRTYQTGFGPRFIVEGELNTPAGRRPRVRTVWQFDYGAIAPRLITAYPLENS